MENSGIAAGIFFSQNQFPTEGKKGCLWTMKNWQDLCVPDAVVHYSEIIPTNNSPVHKRCICLETEETARDWQNLSQPHGLWPRGYKGRSSYCLGNVFLKMSARLCNAWARGRKEMALMAPRWPDVVEWVLDTIKAMDMNTSLSWKFAFQFWQLPQHQSGASRKHYS